MAAKKKASFKPFDKCLARNAKTEPWVPVFYGYYDEAEKNYVTTSGQSFKEMIAYNAVNKELYMVIEKVLKEPKKKDKDENSGVIKENQMTQRQEQFKEHVQRPNGFFIRCMTVRFEEIIRTLVSYGGDYLFDFTTHTINYLLKANPSLKETDFLIYFDNAYHRIIKIVDSHSQTGQNILRDYKEIYLV